MNAGDFLLLPRPHRLIFKPDVCVVPPTVRETFTRDLAAALEQIPAFNDAPEQDRAFVSFKQVGTDQVPAQGYRLEMATGRIHIEASDRAGAFYAVITLRQVLRQHPGTVPACRIEDRPDFPSRGVMLDISRDKVPTMDTLYAIVDLLAELKINHVELYTEHTFAYRHHRDVWADASPMTGDEIRALDAYCRARFIELVPNQNSFGHLHRWLKWPRYRDLAECPDGYITPWNERRADPFSLNPLDPRSIALMEELYTELLPNFTSGKFNVGCDETFDLGQGRSRAECERRGKGRVYLDFLMKIYERVKQHGRTMHFWGDIVLNHPELIPDLPRDVVALVWGYEADHPFNAQCQAFADAGIPFYVCPGTSTWNSIAGRTTNCLANISSAAECGLRSGAIGLLITDWGDNGHWQPLPVSFLPYAAGASHAWCGETNRKANLQAALDLHVFHDRAQVMARLVHDLGNAYLQLDQRPANASMLFRLLRQEPDEVLKNGVGEESLQRAKHYVHTTFELNTGARMDREDGKLVLSEIMLVGSMLEGACERALLLKKGKPLSSLAVDSRHMVDEFRRLWLARNRPGGLSDSIRVLERRLAETQ